MEGPKLWLGRHASDVGLIYVAIGQGLFGVNHKERYLPTK
jgi:hypothetical protein